MNVKTRSVLRSAASDPTPSMTRGRVEILDELIQLHAREIQHFLLKLCGDHHDAEELAQDVFVKAYRRLEQLREPQAARRWLYTIAVNHFNDWLRPRRRRPIQVLGDLQDYDLAAPGADDAPQTVAARELETQLHEAMLALPDRQRSVILLFSAKNFDYDQIAEALDISREAAKVNLFHAREKLRRVAERYQQGEGTS